MIIRSLALLLLGQLLLTAALYWPQDTHTVERTSLVRIGQEPLDTIRITATDDGTRSELELRREGGNWLLPSGLPADTGRVDALMDALLRSDPGYPIAGSEAAARRFELVDDRFGRLIELRTATDSARLYLGSSPSFRKVHARVEPENEIYVLDFNSFDAPADESGWLDRGLLAITDVRGLVLRGSRFRLEDGLWQSSSGEVDADAMAGLVTALAGLRVTGLATADDSAALNDTEAVLTLAVESGAGTASELGILTLGEQYFVRSSAYSATFSSSSWEAQNLVDAADAVTGVGRETPDAATDDAAGIPPGENASALPEPDGG